MAVLETHHLTKHYGKSRGIEDLNLKVDSGQIFGFLGPNGAGKTTTIRLLMDLIRPTSGTARVFDFDTRREGVMIRQHVGYLPGDFRMYPHLTGWQLLGYLGALRGQLDAKRVNALRERLDADLDRRIGELSHGNRQKVGLIQAFMHKPKLLILDEPTTGLDPLIQREFHALVNEVRTAGRTVFFSSHVLPEVERLCDRVAIVRDGKLVTVDTVAHLKSQALRHVEIVLDQPVPPEAFADLAEVDHLVVEGSRVRCRVQGSMDALVKRAAQYDVIDFVSHEPTLEELFLTVYGAADAA